jgi:transposase-like protein
MKDNNLSAPQFQNPEAARQYLEAQVWPNGPVCPHCGVLGDHYPLKGKSTRPGLYKCKDCREPFTVTVGTVFERSKISLNKWLMATYLLCSSKKGISTHQLHRTLGVTYKSAWFMTHRIREAMKSSGGLLGGGGRIVEADETYYGRIKGRKAVHGGDSAHKVLALVERAGTTRAFHVPDVTGATLKPVLLAQIAKDTHLMTDGAYHYRSIGNGFLAHEIVKHTQGEYAYKSKKAKGVTAHTNTVESFFGILKRGLVGTYHHVSEEHLQRYVTEFGFRFSHRKSLGVEDPERADILLRQIRGKRLTYRRLNKATPNLEGNAN